MNVRHGSATARGPLRRALRARVHRPVDSEFCNRRAREAIES